MLTVIVGKMTAFRQFKKSEYNTAILNHFLNTMLEARKSQTETAENRHIM